MNQCHLDKDNIAVRILLQRVNILFIRCFSIFKSIQRNKFVRQTDRCFHLS